MAKPSQLAVLLALAILASASTWFYVNRILRAQQVADAAKLDIPRGNLSDLYPRWLGARELLLHGRNPYSPEITREIQQGYYGRALDPSRPNDPKDQQGFAYPVYVVFLLAPIVKWPFNYVGIGFRWLLIALAPISVWLWLRMLRWRPPCLEVAIYTVLLVGWWPMVQGIKLQQLTLMVAGFFAACGACLAAGWMFAAGALLALATIKPQLAWPLVLWLLLWTVQDWRARRNFAFGFAVVILLLLGGAEFVLPGWIRMFAQAIGQYHQYTHNQSVLVWLFGEIGGRLLEVASVIACALCVWRRRREPATSAEFGRALAVVLALTALIVPMFAPYNQILLVPAILALIRSNTSPIPILPAIRLARGVAALLVVWPWIATLFLSAAYLWITPALREKVWPMPFYSNFVVPVFLFAVVLLDAWMTPARGLRDSAAAE